jgi:hypothetical protein
MRRRVTIVAGTLLVVLVGGLLGCDTERPRELAAPAASPAIGVEPPRQGETTALEKAIAGHASAVWVEGEGTVRRLLRDDLRGRRHQRFVLDLPSGGTLLIAHNTQLADRAPVAVGATVRFRGRYEWNTRGGVVHWTHRDPAGGDGGWLELAGRRYE